MTTFLVLCSLFVAFLVGRNYERKHPTTTEEQQLMDKISAWLKAEYAALKAKLGGKA